MTLPDGATNQAFSTKTALLKQRQQRILSTQPDNLKIKTVRTTPILTTGKGIINTTVARN